jgi:hypothetical protein
MLAVFLENILPSHHFVRPTLNKGNTNVKGC